MKGLVRRRFSVPVDGDEVARAWGARGFSCGLFVDPPGREWNGFVHDCDELVVLAEGALEVEVAGETVRLEPGDEVFIPRGATHSVRNRGATLARWYYGYN